MLQQRIQAGESHVDCLLLEALFVELAVGWAEPVRVSSTMECFDSPRNFDTVSGSPDGSCIKLWQLGARIGELGIGLFDIRGTCGTRALSRQTATGDAAAGRCSRISDGL